MDKTKIKVSIIVPVYNVEIYLDECLDSLVNQTLKEIEVIVVNDGSLDNSQLIIDRYKSDFPQLIKSFIKENGGLGDTRNYGVDRANGEYIAFVDSDDYVDLDTFEKLYEKANNTNADVVVYSLTYVRDFNKKKSFIKHPEYFGTSVKKNSKVLLESRCIACNKLIRKELWQKYNFRFPNIWFEDSAVMFSLLLVANKVECLNQPMYYYRETREGAITNLLDIRNLHMLTAADMALEFYKNNENYKIVERDIHTILLKYIISRLRFIKKCSYSKVSKKIIKEYSKYLDKTFLNWKKEEFLSYRKGNFKRNINNFLYRNLYFFNLYCMIPKSIKKLIRKSKKMINMTIKNFENILINNKAKIIKKEEENKEKRRKNLQQNGYKILSEIMRLFNSIEVVAFADFGTLLGLVRENSFLKHDLDMDIGVLTDSKTKINFIIMNLERAGFRIWREFYYKKNIVEISCNYKNVKIDFNFYKVENDKIHTWLFYKLDDKKYIGNYRDCVQMTYNNFKKTDEIIIRNHMIVIPHEPEKLLIEKYGKNWKVPDKNWIYWESPAATKMNEQGYFIQYKYENDIVNK